MDESKEKSTEDYFLVSYMGAVIEDLTILSTDGTIDLYECKECLALTRDPLNHIEWHKKNEH